jgi:hypothetical protein
VCPRCGKELRQAPAVGIHPFGTQPDVPDIKVCDVCRLKITEHTGIGKPTEDLTSYEEWNGAYQQPVEEDVAEDHEPPNPRRKNA